MNDTFTDDLNANIHRIANATNQSETLFIFREHGAFNQTIGEYLEANLGPKQIPLEISIPVTVIYSFIFITGLVGNGAVCMVIVRHNFMHTATNYYLFNLAISDLTILLLGLPNDLSVYWHQYPWLLGKAFCKIRAYLSEAAGYVSVLTIVAFSMERYLAICHPLHLYAMSGLNRAIKIIAILWMISLISSIPFGIYTTIHRLEYPPHTGQMLDESAFCAMWQQPEAYPIWELSVIFYFILPLFLIIFFYLRMGLKIRNRTGTYLGKGISGNVHGETRLSQSKGNIIRMLAAVVIAFFVCWAPFHAQRLLYIYRNKIGFISANFKEINSWVYYITGIFYYVSSTINPILYNLMSNKYRQAFRKTLCCNRFKLQTGSSRHTVVTNMKESGRQKANGVHDSMRVSKNGTSYDMESSTFETARLIRIESTLRKNNIVVKYNEVIWTNDPEPPEQFSNISNKLIRQPKQTNHQVAGICDNAPYLDGELLEKVIAGQQKEDNGEIRTGENNRFENEMLNLVQQRPQIKLFGRKKTGSTKETFL